MNWGEVTVQWLHIFFGTFWFGGTLFANFVMIPAITSLPMEGQRPIIDAIARQGKRVIPLMAGGAIVLGFLRGTVFGSIRDLNALSTTYGIEWLVGLVAAAATFAWGQWVLSPAAERFNAESAPDASTGQLPAVAAARLSRLKLLAL